MSDTTSYRVTECEDGLGEKCYTVEMSITGQIWEPACYYAYETEAEARRHIANIVNERLRRPKTFKVLPGITVVEA